MGQLRLNFAARVTLFSTVLVGLSVALCAGLVYRHARADLEKSIGAELLAISRSAASLIDTDLVDLIHRNEDGTIAFEDEFHLIRGQLDRLRRHNELPETGNPIYIMRPERGFETSGLLEFVVMPDRDEEAGYFVGNLYPAHAHHRLALAGVPTASSVYRDDEGVWISASAPLFDSKGQMVGIVQVDRPADFFDARARARAVGILWGAVLAASVGAILSILFARSLVRPLGRIAGAARALSRGELHERLAMTRRDEVGDLANSFDQMVVSLRQQTLELEQERERAETARRAMIASARLATLGELAVGVAHEINNPLAYARSNLSLLDQHWQEICKWLPRTAQPGDSIDVASEGHDLIAESLEGLDRAAAVVRDIRGLAHAGSSDREAANLNELCDIALRVVTPHMGPRTRIERVYSELPPVTCSIQEIEQVMLNLLLNADHAMREHGGELRVETLRHGSFARIRVSDEGEGIRDSLRERIFDPFFTTKPAGEGTGLGLSVALEIIRNHGGELRAMSGQGSGAVFEIDLPLELHPDCEADPGSD